jgi:hypothetical protein
VCIKLKNKLPVKNKGEKFLQKVTTAVTGGYDVVVSTQELSCDSDWFLAECKKRIPETTGGISQG